MREIEIAQGFKDKLQVREVRVSKGKLQRKRIESWETQVARSW